MLEPADVTARIYAHARELGFDVMGVAPVNLGEDAAFFESWLAAGHAAQMDWIGTRKAERLDPDLIVSGIRSVLCLGMFYLAEGIQEEMPPLPGKVARYARGRDYHQLINKRLRKLRRKIEEELPGVNTYVNVDTGPVLERSFAARAGLGWIGHNTCLIDPEGGSYLFLAEVLLDRELVSPEPPRKVIPDCGTCTACIDACPTKAFPEKGVLDSRRCISYLTIENREAIPEDLREGMGAWVFGCDICQEVCPWNREPRYTKEADFTPRPGHGPLDLLEILSLPDEDIEEKFLGSPLRRAKGRGLKRNALVALGNLRDPAALPALKEFAESDDSLLAEHARWAVKQIQHKK